MATLPKGGNCKVEGNEFDLVVSWTPESVGGKAVSLAAVLLDAQGKARQNSDVVHSGATKAAGTQLSASKTSASLKLCPAKFPSGTERLVVLAYSENDLNSLGQLESRIHNVVDYGVEPDDRKGKVIAVCEIYLRKGEWKFRALGQAKDGGISDVLSQFGIAMKLVKKPQPKPAAPANTPRPTTSSSGGGINLSKISLDKAGSETTINLSKDSSAQMKEIVINLNWTGAKKKFFTFKPQVDLDLGCFLELRDGLKFCIDGLQFAQGRGGPRHVLTMQGCYTAKPWIWHTGDDRSGRQSEGEDILINPKGFGDIKRVHIYAYIYEGAARWNETNAVVTVKVPGNPELEVPMGNERNHQTFCVIATLDFLGPDSVKVSRAVTFHQHHGGADVWYQWGLKWGAGSK